MSDSLWSELPTVLQWHGSQGPSHSFEYKGRTNALKGAGEMLATGKPAQLSGGESQPYKGRAGASGIENREGENRRRKKDQMSCEVADV